MAKSLTKEQSDALESELKAIPEPPMVEIAGHTFPQLERSSRFGSRESFLQRALESFTKIEGPAVIGDFYGGMCSHITFRSNTGEIYSWFECPTEKGYSKDNVRFHGIIESFSLDSDVSECDQVLS